MWDAHARRAVHRARAIAGAARRPPTSPCRADARGGSSHASACAGWRLRSGPARMSIEHMRRRLLLWVASGGAHRFFDSRRRARLLDEARLDVHDHRADRVGAGHGHARRRHGRASRPLVRRLVACDHDDRDEQGGVLPIRRQAATPWRSHASHHAAGSPPCGSTSCTFASFADRFRRLRVRPRRTSAGAP